MLYKQRKAKRDVLQAATNAKNLKLKLKKKMLKISLSPLKGFEPNCFSILDSNGNGTISKKELNIHVLKACLAE